MDATTELTRLSGLQQLQAILAAKTGYAELSDYPISSAASESGSAEVAMHCAFAACD